MTAPKFMKWTSTQNHAWGDECRAFAERREEFRLDHVCGDKELGFCATFCAQHQYKKLTKGSSILFIPIPG